jgi:hypothetical protein
MIQRQRQISSELICGEGEQKRVKAEVVEKVLFPLYL